MSENKNSRAPKGTKGSKSKNIRQSPTTFENYSETQGGIGLPRTKSEEEFLFDQPMYPPDILRGISTRPKNIPVKTGSTASSFTGTKESEEDLLIDQPMYPPEILRGISTVPENLPVKMDSAASSSYTGARKKTKASAYLYADNISKSSTNFMLKTGDTETNYSATNPTKCGKLKKKTKTRTAEELSSISKLLSDTRLSTVDRAAQDTAVEPKQDSDSELYFKDDHFSSETELYFKEDHFA